MPCLVFFGSRFSRRDSLLVVVIVTGDSPLRMSFPLPDISLSLNPGHVVSSCIACDLHHPQSSPLVFAVGMSHIIQTVCVRKIPICCA